MQTYAGAKFSTASGATLCRTEKLGHGRDPGGHQPGGWVGCTAASGVPTSLVGPRRPGQAVAHHHSSATTARTPRTPPPPARCPALAPPPTSGRWTPSRARRGPGPWPPATGCPSSSGRAAASWRCCSASSASAQRPQRSRGHVAGTSWNVCADRFGPRPMPIGVGMRAPSPSPSAPAVGCGSRRRTCEHCGSSLPMTSRILPGT